MELIAVTLNAPNDWNDHKNMLDYGFSKVEVKTIIKKGSVICNKNINGQEVQVLCADDAVVPYFGSDGDYTVVTHIAEKLQSPINSGDKIGICDIEYKGKIIKQIDLISDKEVYKKQNVFDLLMGIFK